MLCLPSDACHWMRQKYSHHEACSGTTATATRVSDSRLTKASHERLSCTPGAPKNPERTERDSSSCTGKNSKLTKQFGAQLSTAHYWIRSTEPSPGDRSPAGGRWSPGYLLARPGCQALHPRRGLTHAGRRHCCRETQDVIVWRIKPACARQVHRSTQTVGFTVAVENVV